MHRLFAIALAGAVGTLARYGLAGLVQRFAGISFPWGTLAVNLAGCLAAGLLVALAETRMNLPPDLRLAVFIGFMGAFTTFSTYMLETGALLRDGEWALAAGNMLLHNLLGLAAFIAGFTAGRSL